MFWRSSACVCVLLFLFSRLSASPKDIGNAILIGFVTNDRGEAVASGITLYRLATFNGEIVPTVECSSEADASRYFRCEHLVEGTYVLVLEPLPIPSTDTNLASSSSHESGHRNLSPSLRMLPTFVIFPSLDSGLQNLIHLSKGQTESIDIRVSSDEAVPLKAKPALGFDTGQVQMFAIGSGFLLPINIMPTSNPGDREYIWSSIPSGTYKFIENWSEKQDSNRHYAIAFVSISPSTPQEFSFVDARTHRLTGIVKSIRKDLTSARVVLDSMDGNDLKHYVAPIQKGDSFVFNEVLDGAYRMSMTADSTIKINQVSIAGRPLSDQVIFVGEATSASPVVITAAPAKGSVTGILDLDGSEPKPGVVIQSLDSHTSTTISVQPGGYFQADNLAPGTYRVFGWADISEVPYNTSSFLAPFKDKSVEIEIREGSPVIGIRLECIQSTL